MKKLQIYVNVMLPKLKKNFTFIERQLINYRHMKIDSEVNASLLRHVFHLSMMML